MITRADYDEAYKMGAVELSHAKGKVKAAALQLEIDASRLSKWRQRYKDGAALPKVQAVLTEEQKDLVLLRKKLKDSGLERDILKNEEVCTKVRALTE